MGPELLDTPMNFFSALLYYHSQVQLHSVAAVITATYSSKKAVVSVSSITRLEKGLFGFQTLAKMPDRGRDDVLEQYVTSLPETSGSPWRAAAYFLQTIEWHVVVDGPEIRAVPEKGVQSLWARFGVAMRRRFGGFGPWHITAEPRPE